MYQLLMLLAILLVSVHASSQSINNGVSLINNTVYSMAQDAEFIYMGGDFTRVNTPQKPILFNYGAEISKEGKLNFAFSKINGTIYVAKPDGVGGWYIGGNFTKIGTITRNYLAHIYADGSLNLNWNPNVNNTVKCLIITKSSVYAGGDFTQVNGLTARGKLAKFNLTDGKTIPNWKSDLNNTVLTLALSDKYLYVGGTFTKQDHSIPCSYLIRIDTETGQTDPIWKPEPRGRVLAITTHQSSLFVGGHFYKINGNIACGSISKLNTIDGKADLNWTPIINGGVHAISIIDNELYVGGSFYQINKSRDFHHLAKLSIEDGKPSASWQPKVSGPVYTIVAQKKHLYIGGLFSHTHNVMPISRLARIHRLTGIVDQTWNPHPNNSVYTLAIYNKKIFIGGSFNAIGGHPIPYLCRFRKTTGMIDPTWNPEPDHRVSALVIDGHDLFIGGSFTVINGSIKRNRIAKINTQTGQVDSDWDVDVNRHVTILNIVKPYLYIGGYFREVNGQQQHFLARTTLINPQLDTKWKPLLYSPPKDLAFTENSIYAVGGFSPITEKVKIQLAKINTRNGAIDYSWLPLIEGGVATSLAIKNNQLYIGGGFKSIDKSSSFKHLARFNTAIGTIDPTWAPAISSDINSMLIHESAIYVAGNFKSPYSNSINNHLLRVNLDNNSVDSLWEKDHLPISQSNIPYLLPYTLLAYQSDIYAGGSATHNTPAIGFHVMKFSDQTKYEQSDGHISSDDTYNLDRTDVIQLDDHSIHTDKAPKSKPISLLLKFYDNYGNRDSLHISISDNIARIDMIPHGNKPLQLSIKQKEKQLSNDKANTWHHSFDLNIKTNASQLRLLCDSTSLIPKETSIYLEDQNTMTNTFFALGEEINISIGKRQTSQFILHIKMY